jgi:hypothetical protein
MREHISKYNDPKEADSKVKELEIHMRHFEDAMKKIRPLSTQELNMYRRMAEQFGKSDLPSVGSGGLPGKGIAGTTGSGTGTEEHGIS